ncbi:MAG: class I SAM-dependent methyltransferase [Alcaligenaceae bacterium]|nr:class I SAM-dependent methyltransferase [Alcaligenaceae bacterium]
MSTPNHNIGQYQHYFASGHYDRRYPRPNFSVLRLARKLLPPGGRVLDYGCGSGRYLLELRHQAQECIGFDICAAALARLNDNLTGLDGSDRITLLGPEAYQLECYQQQTGPVDLALCLFGVLAHIDTPEKRQKVLKDLVRVLDPVHGRLIISVPNRRRRFRKEQRAFRGQDQIRYTRRFTSGTLELSYRLYDSQSLTQELAQAGFSVERLRAESVFPESWLARSAWLARIDHWFCRWLPADLGYGVLAVARPESDGKR